MVETEILEPTTTVTDVDTTVTRGGGMAGIVVCIGSFGAVTDNQIKSYTNPRIALAELKGEQNTVPEEALGYHALDYLFSKSGDSLGIEELLVVNTTTENEGDIDYTLTNEKLADALKLIDDEQFHILYVADVLDETKLANIKSLRDDMYKIRFPWGLNAAVKIESEEDIDNIAKIFETGGDYKLITTQKQLEGSAEPLSLVNTVAWDTAYTAGLMVNQSETGKQIPEVIGTGTKEEYPECYERILKKGLHSQKIYNRRLKEIRVNSIRCCNGYDMAINRTKDFIVGDLALRDIYGNPNSSPSYEFIKGMFELKKTEYVEMGLIDDMKYDITECNTKCVKAEIELFIPDILVEVKLFVKVTPTSLEVKG